jgi:formylglycine-generating enzyme required for sulfatase activity
MAHALSGFIRCVAHFILLAGCGDAGGGSAIPDDGGSGDGPSESGSDATPDASSDAPGDGCPPEMVRIDAFCVDRYEATLVEVDANGSETPHSPYLVIAPGTTVRARSAGGVFPQGYVSQTQASEACANAGKRLCGATEFALACRGPDPNDTYPYGGQDLVDGACNEGKGSAMPMFFGNDPSLWTYDDFNDPILNQWEGGLARTGDHPSCVSPYGVYDCVGNLHEWGSDEPDAQGHGRFRGGFYGDAEINGPGCLYVTSAHGVDYHDYSTGFRCCRDAM